MIGYCEQCKRFELHLVYRTECLACLSDMYWHEVTSMKIQT
jgi:hypothetical protein